MNKEREVRNTALIVLFVCILLIGCGRKETRVSVIAGGAQVKVQTREGTATITAGAGDISALPEPLRYPGAVLTGTSEVQTPQGAGKTYVLETADPKSTVVQFYKNAMPDWSNRMTTETSEGVVITAASSEGRQGMSVAVTTKGGKTEAAVVYWQAK